MLVILVRFGELLNNKVVVILRLLNLLYFNQWGRRGRDHMVVGFTTTCAISYWPQVGGFLHQ
jgi:hypothetical protein